MAPWTRPGVAARSLCTVAAISAYAGIAVAQHRPPAAPAVPVPVVAPAPPGAHALTAEDLESFLDGLMPLQIRNADIAGAVVAVVKDGHVLFEKGYGYADVAAKRPVIADSTLFRPGSISKLFTWTAVMQQVEAGKLDLDRDVNAYLDFKIPASFGRPITLRDLMTHRPGFEETVKDLAVDTATQLRPIGQYLRTHVPAQIFAPGTVPAYSNYGATLAAYIVERVSGQSFDDYVEQHILTPLQMAHSTFRQPLPAAFVPLLSNGYDLGSQEPKPFELIEVAPAGAMTTSADDITHFMIAQLGDGSYGGGRILQPATLAKMHERQTGWPDSMHAFALGFYEESQNGHRIIGHGGDTQVFHSDLHLDPRCECGVLRRVQQRRPRPGVATHRAARRVSGPVLPGARSSRPDTRDRGGRRQGRGGRVRGKPPIRDELPLDTHDAERVDADLRSEGQHPRGGGREGPQRAAAPLSRGGADAVHRRRRASGAGIHDRRDRAPHRLHDVPVRDPAAGR